ncbi:MAG: hypothetical protein WA632_01540 [Gallionella sp.]
MNNIFSRNFFIFAILASLMAATRFDHFGSSVALPDASYAIFFLGGVFLTLSRRLSVALFTALILEAGLIDVYATSVQGISDWCMTPAYWFLIPTYASLWLSGRWFSSKHSLQGKGLAGVMLTAFAATSFAFAFSNATFYLFSDRFAMMGAAEYATRVSQYYGSYVSVALLYIACAVAVGLAFGIGAKHRIASGAGAV